MPMSRTFLASAFILGGVVVVVYANWPRPSVADRCYRIYMDQFIHQMQLDAEDRSARELRKQYPNMAGLGYDSAMGARDPAPPPPRPSELAWYNEHCWDGKARP